MFGYSFFFVENVTSTILTPTKRKLLKADHLHDELEEDEDLELPPLSPRRRYDYMTDPFTSCSRSESSTPFNLSQVLSIYSSEEQAIHLLEETVSAYSNRNQGGRSLDPHIFAVAEEASPKIER